jgi:hypothetical protein
MQQKDSTQSQVMLRSNDEEKKQLITCLPRFMLGVNSAVQNAIFYVEDNIVLYVAGHNVVFYSMNERA